MQILNKIRNPIKWALGLAIKITIKKLFFNKIENKDFNSLVDYTLNLLPNETITNITKLLLNTLKSKPSELTQNKLLDQVMQHTLPLSERVAIIDNENLSFKYLFIFLILGNILKRLLFLIKNFILLPFKLGVWGFIAFLFGIKVDWFLALFDTFNFNIPSWTYNKLLELHIRWLSWLKIKLEISSISTDLVNTPQIPKIKNINIENETEIKPETYLYLTKKQWTYIALSTLTALAAYYGYTFGIPFRQEKEWEFDPNDKGEGSSKGKGNSFSIPINNPPDTKNENSWQDTLTNLTTKIITKIKNLFTWGETDEDFVSKADKKDRKIFDYWRKRQDQIEIDWLNAIKKGELTLEEYKDLKENNENLIKIVDKSKSAVTPVVEQVEPQEHKDSSIKITDKKSSPTAPDAETQKNREKYFPHKNQEQEEHLSSFKEEGKYVPDVADKIIYKKIGRDSNKKSLFYSTGKNDSTETITPDRLKLEKEESRQTKILDKNKSEDSFNYDEEQHTYPPKNYTRFSDLSNHPFSSGYNENIDETQAPSLNKKNSALNLLSARFLDNFRNNNE